ncbi:MAG: adenylosuccinate lyase [Anaerolineales bacterium]|nr:adenylosuccinate lyase [Anaerolineales bacterium]
MTFSHDTFISPLTWRYGGSEMRRLWSEVHKRRLLRRVWVALAEAQHEAGLVTTAQLKELRAHADVVDIERTIAIEHEIKHDLVAELRTFAEQCPSGGAVLHMGATSMDILDNADALRIRASLELLRAEMCDIRVHLVGLIDRLAEVPAMGFTHLQPAEPTTVGYRLAQHGQDFLSDYSEISRISASVCGKGFKGAVGTSASFVALLAGTNTSAADMEARAMELLGLEAFPVSTQTYPRKQDWLVLNALAGLGGTLYRFAFDLRLLQSPLIGEWSEPFVAKQVGSSAMPFKRNPISAEKIDSLARYLAGLPRVAWDNAAHSLLERTLDDSANRRLLLPQAFLIADELLRTAKRLLGGLQVDRTATAANMQAFGVFAGTEPLLMALCKAGADRNKMHLCIRDHAMRAWEAVRAGSQNPLVQALCSDEQLLRHLPAEEIEAQVQSGDHVGLAPERARAIAQALREN